MVPVFFCPDFLETPAAQLLRGFFVHNRMNMAGMWIAFSRRTETQQTHTKRTDLWVRCAFGVRSVWGCCAFGTKLLPFRLDLSLEPILAFCEPGHQHCTDVVAGCIQKGSHRVDKRSDDHCCWQCLWREAIGRDEKQLTNVPAIWNAAFNDAHQYRHAQR